MRYKDKLVEKVTNCRRFKVQIVCVSMIDLNYKIKGAYKGLPSCTILELTSGIKPKGLVMS